MAIGTELAKLFVRIGADTSELQSGLKQAQSATNQFASGIKNVGNNISQVGRGLTAGLTLPIIGLGAVALKASIDFESAFAGVRKTVDASEAEFATLRQGIRDMAKEMPLSASKIAEVAEAAGQLGIGKDDVLAFTKTMVKLGATTNLSATEAATGMARLANVMQVPLKDVNKLADVLVNLGNKGASTEKEILDMALRIAGAAQQIGMSATDVLAFANALSSLGIEAEAGGSAISRVFIDIAQAVAGLDPTPEQLREISDATSAVVDASDNLSQAQRGVRDAGEGVADAQRGVRDALEGVDAAQRASRNATEQLRDAYKNLAAAQRDQRQASLDARRETLSVAEAMQGLREVQSQAGSGALEVRSAQLALADAQRRLAEASKKGGLEQQQAALAVQQAQARLQQTIIAGPRYSLDLRNAQLRLEEAQNRVGSSARQQADKIQQAQRDVRNASEGVSDARRGERNAIEGVDGANRNLRNSQEGVTDAQKAANKASRDLESAQQKLNDLTDAGSAKLRLFAEVSGMSVEEFSKLFKSDPSKAITAFVEGLGKIKQEGGNVFGVLDKLGLSEVRQRDALLRLAGGGDILRKSLEDAATSAGALDKEFEQRSQTAAAQLAIKWNQITDSMITLGDTLKPIMMDLLAAAQPFFDAFAKGAEIFAGLPKPVQEVIVGLALLLAALGPLLMIIGSIASGVGAIIAVFGFMGISVGGLAAAFGALFIAALPWIALAAAIVLAGYLIYKNWDTLKDAAKSVSAALLKAGKGVLDFFKSNWREVGALLSGPFLPLVALATDAFGIRSALTGAFSSLIGTASGLAGQVAGAIAGAFTGAVGAAGGIAGGLASAIGGAITSVLDTIKSNFNAETMGEAFGFLLFAPVRNLRMGLEMLVPLLTTFFGSTLPGFFTQTIPAIASAAFNLGKAIVTGIANAIASLPGFIANAAVAVVGAAINLGKGIATGIASGISAAVAAVQTFFTSTLPGVISGAVSTVATAALAVGKAIIQAVSDGINGAIGLITAAPGVIKNAFISGFNFITTDIYNLGRDIVKGLWNGIKSMTSWITDQVKGFFKGIIKAGKEAVGAKSPSKVFQTIGEDIVAGLALGIKGAEDLVVAAPRMAAIATATSSMRNQPASGELLQSRSGDTSAMPRVPALPERMSSFINSPPIATATSSMRNQPASGELLQSRSGAESGGLNIEVNGPVKVVNQGRRQDVRGAMGDLAFGVKGQLNRRGVYT